MDCKGAQAISRKGAKSQRLKAAREPRENREKGKTGKREENEGGAGGAHFRPAALTMKREELIDVLIATGHLNVPDRKALGRISRREVFNAVCARVERDGRFPPNASEAKEGQPVFEGPQIQRSEDGGYMGINQRASVHDFSVLAEVVKRRFGSVAAVVEWYIDSEWGKGIDGIRIS